MAWDEDGHEVKDKFCTIIGFPDRYCVGIYRAAAKHFDDLMKLGHNNKVSENV